MKIYKHFIQSWDGTMQASLLTLNWIGWIALSTTDYFRWICPMALSTRIYEPLQSISLALHRFQLLLPFSEGRHYNACRVHVKRVLKVKSLISRNTWCCLEEEFNSQLFSVRCLSLKSMEHMAWCLWSYSSKILCIYCYAACRQKMFGLRQAGLRVVNKYSKYQSSWYKRGNVYGSAMALRWVECIELPIKLGFNRCKKIPLFYHAN